MQHNQSRDNRTLSASINSHIIGIPDDGESIVNLEPLPAYELNPVPFKLQSNYAFSKELPYAAYKVMVYGDDKDYLQLKRSISKTYVIRIALCSFISLIYFVIILMVVINDNKFFANFLSLSCLSIIYIIAQLLWWRHYRMSTKNKQCYLRFNSSDAMRFRLKEFRQTEAEVEMVEYRMEPPPPAYQPFNRDPPSYV